MPPPFLFAFNQAILPAGKAGLATPLFLIRSVAVLLPPPMPPTVLPQSDTTAPAGAWDPSAPRGLSGVCGNV